MSEIINTCPPQIKQETGLCTQAENVPGNMKLPPHAVVKEGDTLSGIISDITGNGLAVSGKIAVKLARESGLPVYSTKQWAARNKTTVDAVREEILATGFKGNIDTLKFVELQPEQVVSFATNEKDELTGVEVHPNWDHFVSAERTKQVEDILEFDLPDNSITCVTKDGGIEAVATDALGTTYVAKVKGNGEKYRSRYCSLPNFFGCTTIDHVRQSGSVSPDKLAKARKVLGEKPK